MLDPNSNVDERDSDIVGFKTAKSENWNILESKKGRLTVAAKVEKELAYVTQAMELDVN
jgi:hypothetical protein